MSIGHIWRTERRKLRELVRSDPRKMLCLCIAGLQLLGVIYTMVLVASDSRDIDAINDDARHHQWANKPRQLTVQPLRIGSGSAPRLRRLSINDTSAYSVLEGAGLQDHGNSQYDDEAMAAEMEQRVKQMRETCRRWNSLGNTGRRGKSSQKVRAGEFLVDSQHHLIWCSVFKAGASTMMYNFNLLAGYTKDQIRELTSDGKTLLMTLARKKFPRPTGPELLKAIGDGSQNTVFLVVRHPFERLVSAYRDKFLHAHKGSHHEKLGLRLIAKYRSHEDRKAMQSHPIYSRKPTFHEFVRHVVDEARLLRFDMHWEPYYRFCTPCQVGFNAIVKFETLERDFTYIFGKANVLDTVDSGRRENRGSGESKDYAAEYFGELPTVLFEKLFMIYALDFEMFGYTPDPYRKLLRS